MSTSEGVKVDQVFALGVDVALDCDFANVLAPALVVAVGAIVAVLVKALAELHFVPIVESLDEEAALVMAAPFPIEAIQVVVKLEDYLGGVRHVIVD